MLTNRVGSRTIEDRLSRSGSCSERSDSQPDEPGSNGNVLFACMVVGLFLVGAAAGVVASYGPANIKQAFWNSIMGPPPPPPYRSRVADTCDKGWKDNRFNRDQIHCHMTSDVARLCDPRERRALVDKLYAYQAAMDRSDARYNLVALRMIANPGATMALGMSDAKSRDPNLSEPERAAQVEKTWEMSHEILSPVQEIERDNINTATKKDLVADVKRLVEEGYLAPEDFSASPQPKIVKEGLAAVGSLSRSYCN